MRNKIALGAAALLVTGSVAACGGTTADNNSATSGGAKGSDVALVISGNTGDGGFWDQANEGSRTEAGKLDVPLQVIETGPTPTKWAPALQDAAGNFNVVISGSFAMAEIVEQAAAQHPDKQFVLFDVAADTKKCGGCKNIYSMIYRYDETGYLAGAVAGLVTQSKTPRTNGDNVVGFVGGQDIPVIEDYRKGFIAGVKAVNPTATVESAYAGSFSDPVKGKQLAQNIIAKGADVVFTAAGGTDKGVLEAAAENDVWAIGNSSQQADNSAVNGKQAVLTASDTSVKTSLAKAIQMIKAGKLPTGQVQSFGVKDGTNSIIESEQYTSQVPTEIRDKVAAIQKGIADGSVKVNG